jgi:cytochrome P450
MQLDGQQQGMRPTEVRETALHFALGGYLSTQFLIGTGVYNLLSTPEAMSRYRAAGPVERCAAIEEMKRFDAPFQLADRYAAIPTRLGPCDIPAGARVTVVFGSANRDERIFGADAHQFRIDRAIDPRQNYVFGHGIHTCIGAPMVAAVAPVVFATLIEAMPDLALTGSMPQRVFDPYYRAFASLDLHF